MTDFDKFIEPIYGVLMNNTKIYKKSIEEQFLFKQKVLNILKEIQDDKLNIFLCDDNWRTSLVGSWLIFLKNKTEFIDKIGNFLIQGKSGTIGYCFTLAKFGTIKCSEYLEKYLNKELSFDK